MKREDLVREFKKVIIENLGNMVTMDEAKKVLEGLESIVEDAIVDDKINFAGVNLSTKESKERMVSVDPKKPELGMKLRPKTRKLIAKAGKRLEKKIKSK